MLGLGYNPQVGANGEIIDCDSFLNMFQGVCWNPVAPGVPYKYNTTTGAYELAPTPTISNAPFFNFASLSVIGIAIGAGILIYKIL